MRPLQYKSQYMNLRVVELHLRQSTIEQTSQIRQANLRINQYRNANSDSNRASAVDLREKDRIRRLMRNSGNGYNETDRRAIGRCFNGKANVLECQTTVRIIMELGVTNNIQTYCDTYFGLDCSGFINSYFNSIHGLQEKRIRDYLMRKKKKCKNSF